MKRIFDILLSLLGLICAAPIMLVVTIFLYIDSPGPIFFKQKRLGKHKQVFGLYKFRKFPMDCTTGPCVTVSNDVRMTRVGRVLERTKLDELPQLWNILKGDMSFVGPRPETLDFEHLFTGDFVRVHDFTPGLFGPNQILFRNESRLYPNDINPETFYNEVLFPQKARADINYFSHANFFSDLWLIIQGSWVTLTGIVDWKRLLKLHVPMLLLDTLSVLSAWTLAHTLRLGGLPYLKDVPPVLIRAVQTDWLFFLTGLYVLPPWVLFSLWLGGVYRISCHFSLPDGLKLAKVLFTSLFIAFFLLIGLHFRSASFFIISSFFILLLSFMVCSRLFFRIRLDRRLCKQISDGIAPEKTRVLLYGAGKIGQSLLLWTRFKMRGVEVVGFIDDLDAIQNKVIHDCRVVGKERDIPNICAMMEVTEIWLTYLPREARLQRLENLCGRLNVALYNVMDCEPFCRFMPYTRPKP